MGVATLAEQQTAYFYEGALRSPWMPGEMKVMTGLLIGAAIYLTWTGQWGEFLRHAWRFPV
jgi:hypothetical protein